MTTSFFYSRVWSNDNDVSLASSEFPLSIVTWSTRCIWGRPGDASTPILQRGFS